MQILSHKPRRGELFEIELEAIEVDGTSWTTMAAAVGPQAQEVTLRFEVRGAAPGDRLRVRVLDCHRNVVTAVVDEVLAESPLREPATCRHFGSRKEAGRGCGGCSMQWVGYEGQLRLKREIVVRALAGAGVLPEHVPTVLGSPMSWNYRNKMEFSFGHTEEGNFALGLHPAGRKYDLLDLTECHLESGEVAGVLEVARRWARDLGLAPYRPRQDEGWLRTLTVREGKRTGQRLVELTTTGAATAVCGGVERDVGELAALFGAAVEAELGERVTSLVWTQHLAVRGQRTRFVHHTLTGRGTLDEELCVVPEQPLRFEVHPRAFFQPNTLGAELLYRTVLEFSGLLAGRARTVCDLYCGTGTIGLCLARHAEAVVGVELQPDAVENARRNAADNGILNATFLVGDVGEVLGGALSGARVGVDLVVVDPPRSGLMPKARQHIRAIGAPRLVYVSCNPTALGRDLVDLKRAGYRLERLQPVDMFPQTAHVETVALLTLDLPGAP